MGATSKFIHHFFLTAFLSRCRRGDFYDIIIIAFIFAGTKHLSLRSFTLLLVLWVSFSIFLVSRVIYRKPNFGGKESSVKWKSSLLLLGEVYPCCVGTCISTDIEPENIFTLFENSVGRLSTALWRYNWNYPTDIAYRWRCQERKKAICLHTNWELIDANGF